MNTCHTPHQPWSCQLCWFCYSRGTWPCHHSASKNQSSLPRRILQSYPKSPWWDPRLREALGRRQDNTWPPRPSSLLLSILLQIYASIQAPLPLRHQPGLSYRGSLDQFSKMFEKNGIRCLPRRLGHRRTAGRGSKTDWSKDFSSSMRHRFQREWRVWAKWR